MLTYTGLSITPDNLRSPSAQDIGVHMGRVTRFGGAIWSPLIFHSLIVAGLIPDTAGNKVWAAALLHDACETVSGEVPFPWKTGKASEREEVLTGAVYTEFGVGTLDHIDLDVIKKCDVASLYGEVETQAHPEWRKRWYEVYEPEAVAKGWIRADAVMIEKAKQIARILKLRGFADPSRTINPESGQVRNFVTLLEAVRTGQITRARLALSATLSKVGIESRAV